jgi:hypothetical protein
MAQTRAGAKAFRNRLAWVVVLAGYRPTPAEEMTENTINQNGTGPSEHWCKIHNTPFFKRGKMKDYAHPVKVDGKDTGKWCNEPEPEEPEPPTETVEGEVVETKPADGETIDFDKTHDQEPAEKKAEPPAPKVEPPKAAAAKTMRPRDPDTVLSISMLTNAVFADFHIQPDALAKELGLTHIKDLTIKPSDAYRTIAKAREGK